LHGTPDATVNHRMHRLLAGLRILVAFLGGVLAVVIPALLLPPQLYRFNLGPFFPAAFLCLIMGSFVVSVSALQRPTWYFGAGLGFLMGLIPAALVCVYGFDGGPALAPVIIVYLGVYGFLGLVLGSFGGLIAKLAGWGLSKNHRAGRLVFLKPWHLGVVVLFVDLIASALVR
jgi:hypothetical protein